MDRTFMIFQTIYKVENKTQYIYNIYLLIMILFSLFIGAEVCKFLFPRSQESNTTD